MSAFEDFIQLELPKRPYTETDTPQESVLVRRGPGPRQHVGVALIDGQVLGSVGGQLVGIATSGFGIRKYTLTVGTAAPVWTITHNFNSEEAIIQAFDEAKSVIIPDSIQIIDSNTIQLTFNTDQAGVARAIFLD